MNSITRLANDLKQEWTRLGAPLLAGLRPGMAAGELDARLAEIGLPSHDDLRAWWGWHDGVEPTVSPRLVAAWEVLSVDEAVSATKLCRTVAATTDWPEHFPDSLLAVFADSGGSVIAFDTSDEAGRMVLVPVDDAIPAGYFSGLDDLLSWWLARLRAGHYRLNEYGHLEELMDPEVPSPVGPMV